MSSSIWKLFGSLFDYKSRSAIQKENLEDILKDINLKDDELEISTVHDATLNIRIGQSKPYNLDLEIVKCSHKTGIVTDINKKYGFINGTTYFDIGQVSECLNLKIGDEVEYTAFEEAVDNMSEKVLKIYALKQNSWDVNESTENDDIKKEKKIEFEEMTAIKRLIIGKVVKKNCRKLAIEPDNIQCDMDQISATFVPIEGDWICLEATTTIDYNASNLSGHVLKIFSLQPVLSKSGSGRITYYSGATSEGAIENKIYFCKGSLSIGFMPALGNEVSYVAIESDQGKYKWRALIAKPKEVAQVHNMTGNRLNDLNPINDKGQISITPMSIRIDVEFGSVKEVSFEVFNQGSSPRVLLQARLPSQPANSQLTLKKPEITQGAPIKPNETLKIDFAVSGKFLGFSEETCVFEFEDFSVTKLFAINVSTSTQMNDILNCKRNTYFPNSHRRKFFANDDFNGMVLMGPRQCKTRKFSHGEKKKSYKIPMGLRDVVKRIEEYDGKKNSCCAKILEQYAPYLRQDLNFSHYSERFHTLLYLEELELRINFSKLNQEGVFLRPEGEYLTLEVPGLAESRPSLIVGDKVIVERPWLDKNVRLIGFIHEIHQKKILVKFHESFSQSYDGSECNVSFEPTLGSLRKAHRAVDRAVKKLGKPWLFPTQVNEKSPSLDFEVSEDDNGENVTKDKTSKGFDMSSKKKLVWFNEKINEIQKFAIVNALKGRGRPLPYIIFGPPGTGKTITLVELIMQIYQLVPDSRILVAAPSNSSADLLAERLLDAGKLKPGQLVRLISYHKYMAGSVPEKLKPFVSLIDIGDDSHSFDQKVTERSKLKVSPRDDLMGRYRIIVGTCTCTGDLHFLGYPSGHFTHIVVDEAGQITEPDVLIPASFLDLEHGQVVLVGDPQQLGPVCLSRLATTYGLNVSYMQRLLTLFPYQCDMESFPETSGYDPRFITKLKINYRSVPEILSLPSEMFYRCDLIPTVSSSESHEADIIEKFDFKGDGRDKPAAFIFHSVVGQNLQEWDTPSWFNPIEVWQVVMYLKKLYDLGLENDDVGIITPYTKQVQKIRYLLNILEMAVPKVGTVEDFQGQERHVIIVSTVRSDVVDSSSGSNHSLIGFLACPRRLNVILTRARALLIILGNPVYLMKDPYWKTVLEYCKTNKSCAGSSMLLFENHEP